MSRVAPSVVSPLLGKVGLLGELRVDESGPEARGMVPGVERYVLRHGDRILSRAADHHASLTVDEALVDARQCSELRLALRCRSRCTGFERYVLTERIYNRLVRVAEALSGRLGAEAELGWLHREISSTATHLLAAMSGCDHGDTPGALAEERIPPHFRQLPTRTVIEMENFAMVAWFASLIADVLRTADAVVSPLLGGGGVAPLLAAAAPHLRWHYARLTLYEPADGVAPTGFLPAPSPGNNVLVVDDNLGSGMTVATVARMVEAAGCRSIGMTAIELHWEKLARVRSGSAPGATFALQGLGPLSPFEYRHHTFTARLIAGYATGRVADDRTAEDWLDRSVRRLMDIRTTDWIADAERARIDDLLDRVAGNER